MDLDLSDVVFADVDAEQKRSEARRLRQLGYEFETIGERLGMTPAQVYSAVTGRRGAAVLAWKAKHAQPRADEAA